MTEYHVSPSGDDLHAGDADHPFRSIGRAAALAVAGDTVTVHAGVYRESVDPRRGGTGDHHRIIYRGAPGEPRPVITGSEIVDDWTEVDGHPGVWRVVLPGTMFGDFNPFATAIAGDWLIAPVPGVEPVRHLGEVYLDGRSGYEAADLDAVYEPAERTTVKDNALGVDCPVLDPDQTRYVWHAQVDARTGDTTITANFHDHDPNCETVEVSVRRTCFFPSREHLDYITVRGFEMRQATGDWAPPTAKQWGMVGPNWAHGWIIEDCDLHDVTCSAISLGKYADPADNEWTRTEVKSGYQYQLEAVFKGRRVGWEKGAVGGHIVRNNNIHDCGQNAVVGHMGCAFSLVERNRIRRIGVKREFFGWEVAGIKFHAAVDTVIARNDIADCSLGMWLDWQAQGTRITGNIFHRNVRDLMIEVSHGPYMVDDNIFASPRMFQNWSQGGAFIHNLICGGIELHEVPDRSTPYHFAHTTDVAGTAIVPGGDERWRGNLFAPQNDDCPLGRFGLASYAGHPATMDEYLERLRAMIAAPSQGGAVIEPLQPVYAADNAYCGTACDTGHETRPHAVTQTMPVRIVEDLDGLYLECEVPDTLPDTRVPVCGTADLGAPRIVGLEYEQADGTPYTFDHDMLGAPTGPDRLAGPLDTLHAGPNRVRIW